MLVWQCGRALVGLALIGLGPPAGKSTARRTKQNVDYGGLLDSVGSVVLERLLELRPILPKLVQRWSDGKCVEWL